MLYAGSRLSSVFIADDFTSFYFNLFIEPFPVAPAFHAALVGAAFSAGVEAAHTVFVQTIAQIHPVH